MDIRAYKVKPMLRLELSIVVNAKNEFDTPRETVQALVDRYGKRDARRMIATLVNAVSLHDGRIYEHVRKWAQEVPQALTHEELESLDIYGVDSYIHSAHVNQLGQAMQKLLEKEA